MLCAALPVALALAASVAEYIPSYQRARAKRYQDQLAGALGCSAEVSAVELRAPNQFILHGIKLFHPETSELIARIQSLDVFQNHAGYALRLIKPELPAEQLASTYRLLHEQVLCRPVQRNQATVAWLDELSIQGGLAGRTQFRNVRLEMRRVPSETQASLQFGFDGVGGQPAVIGFARQHTAVEPTTRLRLDSGGQRLPAHWIGMFAPQLAIAGDAATLAGQFELDYSLSTWTVAGSGRLRDVDATAWTQRPMLSGLADVDVSDLSLGDQGLDHVRGQLTIHEGRVHDDLLQSATYVGLNPVAAIAQSRATAHPFTDLKLDFALDWRGLVLKAGLPDGAVASDRLGPLAQQYYRDLVPMANVVTALSKATGPSNQDSDLIESPTVRRLVRWLPRPVTTIATQSTNFQASSLE